MVPGLTRVCPMEVIGEETLMIVGVPPAVPGITVLIGELMTLPAAETTGDGSCNSSKKQ